VLRTLSIKLLVSTETHSALDAVRHAFADACNDIVPYAKENRVFNNVKLHHLCYYDIRGNSQLGSQFTCNAIKAVAGKYKALKLKKNQDVPHIQFRPKSVHYDKKTYTLKDDNTVSLSTLGKRVEAKLIWGKHQNALFEKGLPKEAELIFKNGTWYFNLVVEIATPERVQSNKVMGVDLGENNIAATSTGKVIGGGKLRYDRDRFLAIRRRLQRNGSQSAKQLLKRLSGKEARHVTQVNHQVANAIIAEAIERWCHCIREADQYPQAYQSRQARSRSPASLGMVSASDIYRIQSRGCRHRGYLCQSGVFEQNVQQMRCDCDTQ